MLKSLRIKLMLAGIATLVLLLIGVWGIAWRRYVVAGGMIVLTSFAVIALLLWFWRHVTDPIERLTDFADTIASGSYGSQIENNFNHDGFTWGTQMTRPYRETACAASRSFPGKPNVSPVW